MIISRTPYRVSFFGGGTDYPEWVRREGGAVLSTTVDKYCYVSCRLLPPFFNIRYRIVWSHIETVSTVDEILHPAVREGLRSLGFDDTTALEIHHQGDLPARAGMGSSSTFAVGLIKALMALRGRMVSKPELARQAIELEQVRLRESVGSQDAVAAAHGGLNVIRFEPDGEIRIAPVTIPAARSAELQARLMLFYLGSSRLASAVAADVVANLPARQEELRRMRRMVDEAVVILNEGTLDDFGRLLGESWMLKRQLSRAVSPAPVDRVYETAMQHGALGGKLLGAGGTGFMLFYVPLERQADVIASLSTCVHVPFQFESEGSAIIYYAPDDSLVALERAMQAA
jgi:D-glycero-alpha-D-manno-heptose-7-phosphate kinase